jgi:pyrroline-5-carboxylate reductase
MKIGFIGTGKITNSCVRSLTGKGHNIIVTERNIDISSTLSELFDDVTVGSEHSVVEQSEVICLALMENVTDEVLSSLSFKKNQSIISFILGVNLTRLHNLCTPASDISITIPLPMIEYVDCPLPVYPASDSLRIVFGDKNLIIELSNEDALVPYFAATAILSSSLAQLNVAKKWLENHLDTPEAAEKYLISLMAGTYSSLKIDGQDRINQALTSLSSKGGLNAQLRNHMKKEGTEDSLYNGLLQLGKRLNLN